MPRRTLDDRNIRKLYKTRSGTTLVSLPKELVDELGWRDGQKVVVNRNREKLSIEDWKE
jgi:hypothetical protein